MIVKRNTGRAPCVATQSFIDKRNFEYQYGDLQSTHALELSLTLTALLYWSSPNKAKLQKLAYDLAKPAHNTVPRALFSIINALFDSLTAAIMGRVRTKVLFLRAPCRIFITIS